MNTYGHPDAEYLIPNVGRIIEPLADWVRRAGESGDVDLVYVNDNYGDFTAQFSDLVPAAVDATRPDPVKPIPPFGDCRLLSWPPPQTAWASAPVIGTSMPPLGKPFHSTPLGQ